MGDHMGNIYAIRNGISDKVYVGATTKSLARRLVEHKSDARTFKSNNKFMEAIRELGEINFYIESLEVCDDELLREREAYWINRLNSIKEGYNTESEDFYLVYDINGNYLSEEKTFENIATKYNIDIHNIQSVLTGRQARIEEITIFYRLNFTDDKLQERLTRIKNSSQFTVGLSFEVYKDEVLIGTYKSKTYCAKLLGLTRQKIGQCLLGTAKTHKGYTFRYT